MKKLMIAVLGLTCVAGMVTAGNLDSPGDPSAGSGMYSLKQIYDYLTSGTTATIATSFQEPTSGPGSTMYTTKQIYEAVATPFPQCNATAADVKSGVKFFSTVSDNWGVKTGTMSAGGGLLKTGQTSVYQTGDDGTYQKGTAFSYSWDVGAETVKDNVTGLIWASNGSGAGCKTGGVLIWTSALAWAEGLSFAGYTDWRLPNITELQSLGLRNVSQGAPYINKTFFPNTLSVAYWSSTTGPGAATTHALDTDFGYQSVNYRAKTDSAQVRAVRGVE